MRPTILILGSGAREHAIAAALARSPQSPDLLCFSSARNPGIERLARRYGTGSVTDGAAVTAFARENPLWIMQQYRRRNKFLGQIRREALERLETAS